MTLLQNSVVNPYNVITNTDWMGPDTGWVPQKNQWEREARWTDLLTGSTQEQQTIKEQDKTIKKQGEIIREQQGRIGELREKSTRVEQ
jgi:hypothetical protein